MLRNMCDMFVKNVVTCYIVYCKLYVRYVLFVGVLSLVSVFPL